MEKLVRDKIPELVLARGEVPKSRTASNDECLRLLADKLVEEAHEFAAAPSLEELADVTEVMQALLDRHGWTREELEEVRLTKRRERGGFERGIVLVLDETRDG